jgi:hypothetical protein
MSIIVCNVEWRHPSTQSNTKTHHQDTKPKRCTAQVHASTLLLIHIRVQIITVTPIHQQRNGP